MLIVKGITFTAGTGGLGGVIGVTVIYEGSFSFAVGISDIIGAWYDEPPFVSQLPDPIGSMLYPLPPTIPVSNSCEE